MPYKASIVSRRGRAQRPVAESPYQGARRGYALCKQFDLTTGLPAHFATEAKERTRGDVALSWYGWSGMLQRLTNWLDIAEENPTSIPNAQGTLWWRGGTM